MTYEHYPESLNEIFRVVKGWTDINTVRLTVMTEKTTGTDTKSAVVHHKHDDPSRVSELVEKIEEQFDVTQFQPVEYQRTGSAVYFKTT